MDELRQEEAKKYLKMKVSKALSTVSINKFGLLHANVMMITYLYTWLIRKKACKSVAIYLEICTPTNHYMQRYERLKTLSKVDSFKGAVTH